METAKIRAVSDLIRFNRPVGTYLLLFPALWSLFLAAEGRPPVLLVVVFSLGSLIMRSAGCAINDFADREFDGHVERTKGRPLASGRLGVTEALATFAALVLVAFGISLLLNRLAFYLCFPALFLAISYPFMKRFIHIPQAYMGVAFGWGSIIAWAAVRQSVELPAIIIFVATTVWATAYDTVYAFQDMEDDRRIGVKSSALFFGKHAVAVVAALYAVTVFLLVWLGALLHLGMTYFISLGVVSILFARQIISILATRDKETALKAFKSNTTVGGLVLIGIILDFAVR